MIPFRLLNTTEINIMSIINPKVNIDIIPAFIKPTVEDQKVLFVGQKTAAGTAVSGGFISDISNSPINGMTAWDYYFGEDSLLAAAIRAAKKLNKITRFDAIGLDDAGTATAAVGSISLTGTASSASKITVVIGSAVNNVYEVDIAKDDTETTIAPKIETEINNDDRAFVSASEAFGVITLTAINKGEEGNKITIRVKGQQPGITVTVAAMTGGTVNPVTSSVFDVVGSIRYQTIVWQSTFPLGDVQTFLDDRFNSDIRILDGIAIVSITDTLALLKSTVSDSDRNSQSLAIHCNRKVNYSEFKGSALEEMDFVIAAQFAAIRALRMTDGAPISQFVDATQGSADAFGGIAIASLPYFNTPFNDLPVIVHRDQWTDDERKELNDAGGFVLGNNLANNKIIADRVVTTYLTNSVGDPDITFKYMNYVDTSSTVRWYFH
jgi:phage tail sheath gpL-like